eukprot:sb/3464297/
MAPGACTTQHLIVEDDYGRDIEFVKFPTITICPTNIMKRSYVEKDKNISALWDLLSGLKIMDPSFVANVIKNSTKWVEGYQRHYGVNFDDLRNMTLKASAVSNKDSTELFENGGPDDDRLLHCLQRNVECEELSDYPYFVRETTSNGKCWRINPAGSWYGKTGDWGEMKLMFFADMQDYTSGDSNYGYTVKFHDNEYYWDGITGSHFMSPGFFYKVDLGLKKTKLIPKPIGNCDENLRNSTYGKHTEESCIQECEDRYMNRTCGCVDLVPPHNTPGYTACTLGQWIDCGFKEIVKFRMKLKDPYNRLRDVDDKEDGVGCACSHPCEVVQYDVKLLSTSALSPIWADKLSKDRVIREIISNFSQPEFDIHYNASVDIVKNIMLLDVAFQTVFTTEQIQVITYQYSNLLGDIGGVLGLFLGASLFSILEFAQFTLTALHRQFFDTKVQRVRSTNSLSEERDQEVEKITVENGGNGTSVL